MPLPQDFITQLHDRNEVVDLIGSYVSLKRQGRLYSSLCPFHNEKTPSFVVYPDTQSFYCFGCGTGGDVITFVMQRENLDYIEAVRLLAARAGMTLPEDAAEDTAALRKRIVEANKAAARFFFASLNSEDGKNARGYLRRRGLDDATIRKFGLGYAPGSWDALRNHLNEKGFKNQELVEAGLCSNNKAGTSTFDFFRDRVMFPVIDLRGNVVAFSGRTMGGDSRKYLNTRDTAAFKKSRTLYALNIAKNTTTRRLIVAEGQMDVIAIHKAGFDCAVAALGTALTDEHVRLIARYADEVVLAYDSDGAGQKATRRAIELLEKTNLRIKVLSYRDAKDPDEFIERHGPEAFRELLENSGNSIEYELGRARNANDLETDGGRIQYLKDCAAILSRGITPTERDLYAGRVADETGVSKASLLAQIEQNRKRRYYQDKKEEDRKLVRGVAERYGSAGRDASLLGAAASERRLLALLFASPDLCDPIRDRLSPDEFVSGDMAEIYASLVDVIQSEGFAGIASLSGRLAPEKLAILTGILAENSGINYSPVDADYLIEKIQKPRETPGKEAIREMDAGELREILNRKNRKMKE